MKLQPIGTGSLLSARQYTLYYSLPRLLRLSYAHSLLAERLGKHVRTRIYCHCANSARRRPRGEKPNVDVLMPIDRLWPSDLPLEDPVKRVEGTLSTSVQLYVGGVLDVWT